MSFNVVNPRYFSRTVSGADTSMVGVESPSPANAVRAAL